MATETRQDEGDKSRRFAVPAITLTVGAWIVLPAAVALALAS